VEKVTKKRDRGEDLRGGRFTFCPHSRRFEKKSPSKISRHHLWRKREKLQTRRDHPIIRTSFNPLSRKEALNELQQKITI